MLRPYIRPAAAAYARRLPRHAARLAFAIRPATAVRQPLRAYSYPPEGRFQPNSPHQAPPDPPVPHGHGPPPSMYPGSDPQFNLQHYNPAEQQHQQHQQAPPPPEGRSVWRIGLRIVRGLATLMFCGYVTFTVYGLVVDLGLRYGSLPFEPGTIEDLDQLRELQTEFEMLPLVHILRSYKIVKDGEIARRWTEWDAYQGLAHESRESHLTSGPLKASAGVGAQKVFYDEMTGTFCVIVNFGEGTTGWPGVVHGGVITTIFDEVLGRCAIRSTEKKTAVTANLHVEFKIHSEPGQWFVFLVGKDVTKQDTDTKKYVNGFMFCTTVDHNLAPVERHEQVNGEAPLAKAEDLHVHATATALFVVPKDAELRELEDEF